MLWQARFTSPIIMRPRVALALSLTLIAALACADRVATDPQHAATERASLSANPSPFDDLWVSPHREVNAGEAAWGAVTLTAPAPAGGAHLVLQTNSRYVSLNRDLVVPEGDTIQTFLVQTYPTPPGNFGANIWAEWRRSDTSTVTAAFTLIHVPPPPSIAPLPGNLTFALQAVGTSSAPQTVTVRNNGTVPLTLGVIGVSGPFTQRSNCPATLAPNQYCTDTVRYVPTGAGAQSGLLTIPSDAPNSPSVVTLNGTGFVPTPALSITPGAIGFGSVWLGTATSGRVLKITSTGTAPLVISSLTLAGTNPGDFNIFPDGCSGATLNPGASCTAYVEFEPLRIGTRSATVTIAHNAGGPAAVPLSGTGVKPPGGWVP